MLHLHTVLCRDRNILLEKNAGGIQVFMCLTCHLCPILPISAWLSGKLLVLLSYQNYGWGVDLGGKVQMDTAVEESPSESLSNPVMLKAAADPGIGQHHLLIDSQYCFSWETSTLGMCLGQCFSTSGTQDVWWYLWDPWTLNLAVRLAAQ